MNEDELLDEFLRHGNNYYPQDKAKFLRWAIVAHRNGSDYPFDLIERRLSHEAAKYYSAAFEFVGLTANALDISF